MLSKKKIYEIGFSIGFLIGLGAVLYAILPTEFAAQVVEPTPAEPLRLPKVEVVPEPPPPSPPPAQGPPPVVTQSTYPVHTDITATYFWVGEDATEDSGWIANHDSFWDLSWVEHFGGVDDPANRNGFYPAGFTPKENPFYIALPYSDYQGHKPKENSTQIYWYTSFAQGQSLLKNRWVKITRGDKTAYGQWEDVGPFETDDVEYVFGTARPKSSVGIDVSPAIRDYLGMGGKATVSWQFVDAKDVPDGSWKEIVTARGISW